MPSCGKSTQGLFLPTLDVAIYLTIDAVPPGLAPPLAVERVRGAVKAIPGIGYVEVAWCGLWPPSDDVVHVYRPGHSHPLGGALGERLGRWIKEEVRRALFPGLALVNSGGRGFEGMSSPAS